MIAIIIKYEDEKLKLIALEKARQVKTISQLFSLELKPKAHRLEGATYICSNNYLYRGFGRFYDSSPPIYNKAIHRLRIRGDDPPKDWELVDTEGIIMKSDGKQ
jgi:hypothetical protein